MVSVADGLRMMQGGVDRTGYADMADQLGNPGMDLILGRRAAAAEADAMDEFEKRMEAMFPGNQDLLPPEEDPEEEQLGLIPSIFESIMPDEEFQIDPTYTKPRIQGPGRGVEGMKDGGKAKTTYEKFRDYILAPTGAFELLDLAPQLLGYPGLFNEGGRVGAFSGGIMNNLLGNPQMQNMLQQYRQPTMNFSQVASSSIPQQTLASPTPAQAYTPFVSTMPLYDPSTLGTGLPSTAGMADPYTVYDPYSPVGAFDTPKARTTGFLSREQIDKGFSDLDRFSLAKQRAKAEAAKKAKKETKKGGGGKENRDRFMANKNKNKTGSHTKTHKGVSQSDKETGKFSAGKQKGTKGPGQGGSIHG